MSEQPWTKGPWQYRRMGYSDSGHELWSLLGAGGEPVGDHEAFGEPSPANRAIAALAPEMAEAILAFQEQEAPTHDHCDEEESCAACTIIAVAEQLRSIGASDE